jgi:class 3 adenylate cyclase
VHTGEVELAEDDVRGIAVYIASRVAHVGGANDVLVSRTVKDLVAGSGIRFAYAVSGRRSQLPPVCGILRPTDQ